MSVYYPETLQPTIEYPETDGEPVAESEPQLLSLLYAVSAFKVAEVRLAELEARLRELEEKK